MANRLSNSNKNAFHFLIKVQHKYSKSLEKKGIAFLEKVIVWVSFVINKWPNSIDSLI